MEMKDSVQDCMDFFKKGFPQTGPKNFRTQLGIFLEEIAETLQQVQPSNPQEVMLIDYLGKSIEQAGEHLAGADHRGEDRGGACAPGRRGRPPGGGGEGQVRGGAGGGGKGPGRTRPSAREDAALRGSTCGSQGR